MDGLRESATSRTSKLQDEMTTMKHSTSSVKADWTAYVHKTEARYLEDKADVESGKNGMEEVLHNWYVVVHSDDIKLREERWVFSFRTSFS